MSSQISRASNIIGADLTQSGTFVYDDSNQAPPGLEALVLRPEWPIYNVKNYGARGDGLSDDTPAVRLAITSADLNGGIIYFPAGTYLCMPQATDPVIHTPPCFRISRNKTIFQGEGAGVSILKFRCVGNTDPATTWRVTGESYPKISRGCMFDFDWSNVSPRGPLNTLQLRSLTLDGGCPYTGNSVVGGDPLTGDGWDVSHKALLCNGPVTGILVHCCDVKNWRGECLYAGGGVGRFTVSNSQVRGTNASAVSCSADFTAKNCTFGGPLPGDDVYNGAENFDFQLGQSSTFANCLIQCSSVPGKAHGNGLALLGVPGTTATVTNCHFMYCGKCLLASEVLHDLEFRGNVITGCGGGVITSIVGSYKQFPQGYDNLLIDANITDSSGVLFNMQSHGPTPVNLTISNNLVTTSGSIAAGNYGSVNPAVFTIVNNTLGSGCKDFSGTWQGVRANWSNTTRPLGTLTYGMSVNDFNATSTQTVVSPVSDGVVLNDLKNFAIPHDAVMDPTTLRLYRTGYKATFFIGPAHKEWKIKSDPLWNTLPADLPVTVQGVTLTFDGSRFS